MSTPVLSLVNRPPTAAPCSPMWGNDRGPRLTLVSRLVVGFVALNTWQAWNVRSIEPSTVDAAVAFWKRTNVVRRNGPAAPWLNDARALATDDRGPLV